MCNGSFLFILLMFLFFFLLACYFSIYSKKENFNSMGIGAMGDYIGTYYQCIKGCEQLDPTKTLGTSIDCVAYCDSTATKTLVRKGGPSDPDRNFAKPPVVTTRVDQCYAACDNNRSRLNDMIQDRDCRSRCSCESEVNTMCRTSCSYSGMPESECMALCFDANKVNCYNRDGWTYLTP